MKKQKLVEEIELREGIESLYFAYRSFTSKPDIILKEIGLSRVHHRILYFVGRQPSININQLLNILEVTKQALNAPLRKLIEKDFIKVEAASHDGRIKQLNLSGKGQRLEQRLTETQMQHLARVFNNCTKANRKSWQEIMHQLPL